MARERPPLEEMTLRQLRKVAAELEISRYSRMRKSQLLADIQTILMAKEPASSQADRSNSETQEIVEASKFNLGSEETAENLESLAAIDENIGDLPSGYGESRITLLPRDPQWAYVYWDVPNSQKEELRKLGGQQLALRLYDATDINLDYQTPNNLQEYNSDELAREWYIPIPISDRDYVAELGYRCADGRWLVLTRSKVVHVPPVFPSEWVEDNFITVPWDQTLKGQTFFTLVPPSKKPAPEPEPTATTSETSYDEIFNIAREAQEQRIAGSLYGSMQHNSGIGMVPESISSYVFPSGAGMMTNEMGAGAISASGINYSGIGMLSSSYSFFSSESTPIRPRQFWLVADAELIVYGATEPDASVTIGGRPIKLNADGTFRFHTSFQDGIQDYPIFAVAADGEQNRAIHMKFERQTLERRTNTKEEAIPEWIS
ncbi:DUF4912 domain-containing protein [Pseudanabaena sp. FACHB-1277]|jgi:hypothetical protein|uniref:DUF4912 domain-containing protein n=1 Tax=Pseudanabaena cinerea FACHB-1277 TaxID=2949581 RepID=A0A926UUM4_9CYAN|nr:DUF4912 domain-containing protein [Pseudanabaena cinerea]MBD2151665.1 DUF4912 domain-containing protein [Pseudanabaena cinerea FACHB-1277]